MSSLSRSPTAVSDEGRHARDRGDPITANPYPADSDEHRTWERGYRMPDEAEGGSGRGGAAAGGHGDPA